MRGAWPVLIVINCHLPISEERILYWLMVKISLYFVTKLKVTVQITPRQKAAVRNQLKGKLNEIPCRHSIFKPTLKEKTSMEFVLGTTSRICVNTKINFSQGKECC